MNFKRVTSKNSIKSASSAKSEVHLEEKSELDGEIQLLKQLIESLKTCIESRDAAVGKLAREKENIYVELKGAQRTIRDLRRQLCDERTIHTKEKEYLVEEIQRFSNKGELEVSPKQLYFKQTNVDQVERIDSLQDQLLKKDEIICKLCEKYLKLKNNKSSVYRTIQRVKTEVQETHHKTIYLLEENKHVMDKLFKKMCKSSSSVSLNSKKYLKLLKQNIKLQNENAQLKLCLSTNIRVEENRGKCEKEHEDRDYNPDIVTPPERSHKSQQTYFLSEEELQWSPKPHRRHIKWRAHKLKKLSTLPSLALLGSLYREHISHATRLQISYKKSTSMPSLLR